MKRYLAPSVLSFDMAQLGTVVGELLDGGADIIHLDVMDGQFVPPITFGADVAKAMKATRDGFYEAHLMTETPEAQFEAFAAAGCQRIIFHTEATQHSHRLCQTLRSMGIEAGVAINPGTPVEQLRPLLEVADLFLIMTVNPGWGGQKFIPEALEKVQTLRSWHPTVHIEVDGGVTPETLPQVIAAGANVFVVGSFLAKSANLNQALQELRQCCE